MLTVCVGLDCDPNAQLELALPVAFTVVLLYDHVLTFGEEVEFIWKQNMNIGTFLFLLNRYIPLINQVLTINAHLNPAIPDNQACFALFDVNNWMLIFSCVVIDVILLVRTCALWNWSRVVLISLSTLLVVCILASSGSTLYISLTAFEFPFRGLMFFTVSGLVLACLIPPS